jgi:hypothetical protein
MPYEPDPGKDSTEQLAFQASREVRHTVIRVIGAHLKKDATVSWQGRSFDFNGVVFDSGDFRDAEFSDNQAVFDNAEFSGGEVNFGDAEFSGGIVNFQNAKFSGGEVNFYGTKFSGAKIEFSDAGDWSCPPTFLWTGKPPSGVQLPTSGAA